MRQQGERGLEMISQRARHIEESATLASAQKARELVAQGVDVISMTIGEPDFPTPSVIKNDVMQAIMSDKADHYTHATGIQSLKQAIVKHHLEVDGLEYRADQVVIGTGAKYILYVLFQCLLDEGDEVIIPTPYWVSYSEQVKLAQGVSRFVKTSIENDYKVTVDQLEEHYTEQVKLLIMNSPSNPTGSVYSKEELVAIGEWAISRNVLIISDEIYGRLVYDDTKFVSMGNLSPAISQNVVIVNGLAKSHAMTGWRVGYVLTKHDELVKALTQMISHQTSNLTVASQYAALSAYTQSQVVVENMRRVFEERLNILYPLIKAIPGFKLSRPQGAFYLFPNVKEAAVMTGYDTVEAFVDALLVEAHVAVVSGKAFGEPDCMRISYAGETDKLIEAATRIRLFVENNLKKV